MKLFMGLGNYPREYKYTYHNIGYCAVDYIASHLGLGFKRSMGLNIRYALYRAEYMLAKPQVLMNTSGSIVKKIIGKYSIDLRDMIIVCDDLSLDFGRMKMKLKGGHAGHKGLESIINSLETEQFARIRIGIGRPRDSSEFKSYVLKEIPKTKYQYLTKEVFPVIYQTFIFWKDKGLMAAMNYINSGGKN